MSIYRGPGGSGDAVNDAASEATLVAQLATEAQADADAAAASAAAASTSASSASSSASSASTSASNAATSATNASNSASAASTSATNAATSATAAQTAETAAELAETNAETAETNAASSASAASTSATNAATSASTASTSATNASNSATAAATSATNAATSATSASTSASAASTSATNAASSATSASASAAAASAASLANEPVRHSVRPSLLLDFANTKTLDPRITFTRASTGTYYDGKTTVKAEENLLIYSQEFDNAAWTKTRSTVTANNTTAPDGTTTADLLTADGTSGTHLIQPANSATCPAGQTRTLSVFAKAGTNTVLQVAFGGDTTPYANFDLSGGTVGNNASVTASIINHGNGWYRCVVTTTSTTAIDSRFFIVTNGTSARGESNSLATTVYIWGAQMEFRSSVTAYTPTTTAPITNYIPALQTAASGVARFEHNPVTGESLGLEIEEQRTNLLLRSEEIDNAYWAKTNSSITANAVVAPDGNLTADRLVENTSAGGHNIQSTAFTSGLTSGISYTFSVYVKPAGRNWAVLEMGGTSLGGGYGWFDLSTGALGTQTALSGTSTITAVGNGWYRISITDTSGNTGDANAKCNVYATTGNNVTSYTGDGYSGLYIWGAQLEAGSFATSYIPTVASQVTRSADAASMTGTNFSSWYRADEGTVYTEATGRTNGVFLNVSDNSFANRLPQINLDGANLYVANIVRNSTVVASISPAGTHSFGTFAKFSMTYATNNCAAVVNGGTVVTTTSVILPSGLTQIDIGSFQNNNNKLNGTIKKLAYYPKRLTNAELQGLTTV